MSFYLLYYIYNFFIRSLLQQFNSQIFFCSIDYLHSSCKKRKNMLSKKFLVLLRLHQQRKDHNELHYTYRGHYIGQWSHYHLLSGEGVNLRQFFYFLRNPLTSTISTSCHCRSWRTLRRDIKHSWSYTIRLR